MGAKDWLIGLTVLGGGILAAVYLLPKLGFKLPTFELPKLDWKLSLGLKEHEPIDWTRFWQLFEKAKEKTAEYTPSPELVEWQRATAWRRTGGVGESISDAEYIMQAKLTPERIAFLEQQIEKKVGRHIRGGVY